MYIITLCKLRFFLPMGGIYCCAAVYCFPLSVTKDCFCPQNLLWAEQSRAEQLMKQKKKNLLHQSAKSHSETNICQSHKGTADGLRTACFRNETFSGWLAKACASYETLIANSFVRKSVEVVPQRRAASTQSWKSIRGHSEVCRRLRVKTTLPLHLPSKTASATDLG